MTEQATPTKQLLRDALGHLQLAIDLLDGTDAPGTIAAHADLAMRQLEEFIGTSGKAAPAAANTNATWQSRLTS